MIISPNEQDVFRVLRAFIQSVLPAGVPVRQGEFNRVAEPAHPDFVIMTTLRAPRMGSNFEDFFDLAFTGTIAGDLLTVSALVAKPLGVVPATIGIGSPIFGVGVADNTVVTALVGAGTYRVSPGAQTIAPEKMATGVRAITQPGEYVIQVDVHGPLSQDNSRLITTTFFDPYAAEFFAGVNPAISPLFADDPQQLPFGNEQQQVEFRYSVDLHLEVNQTIRLPQQFAGALEVSTARVSIPIT